MTTKQHTYRVVFWGQVALGNERNDVARKFAKWFNITETRRLKQLFSGRVVSLKKGLTHSQAQRYCDILRGLGAMCRLEEENKVWLSPAVVAGGAKEKRVSEARLKLVDEQAETAASEYNPFAARDIAVRNHPPLKYGDPSVADSVLKRVVSGR